MDRSNTQDTKTSNNDTLGAKTLSAKTLSTKRQNPMKRSKRKRITWIDFVVIAAVIAAGAYVINQVENVLIYNWDWSVIPEYTFRYDEDLATWLPGLLLTGLFSTLRISFWALIMGAILGTIIGLARTSRRRLPRMLGWLYVEFMRNIPPLPFLFLFYFFISAQIIPLLGIRDSVSNLSPLLRDFLELLFGPTAFMEDFLTGVISLSLMAAGYIAEIVRAGIGTIGRSQYEAGHSIGLTHGQTMRYIVLPQAIARILPPLAGQFITLIKDSALISLISINELSFTATQIATSEQRFFEVWLFVGLMYLVVCYSLALVFDRFEARAQRSNG